MTTSFSYFAVFFSIIVALATTGEAFSVGHAIASSRASTSPTTATATKLSMATDMATGEEMVTMRSLNLVVQSKPLGVVLEELGDGKGVFCSECDLDGAAYAAGIRDGDVLAALDGDETILSASLDVAMALLGQSATPLPVKVYREIENNIGGEASTTGMGRGGGTVKMAPRRLPSTKKLIKASTNANFWKDPLMLGSAVLTVAMPLGIYLASTMMGK
jgi:membrane-associated protease RseP (regulator of RpoE activity)